MEELTTQFLLKQTPIVTILGLIIYYLIKELKAEKAEKKELNDKMLNIQINTIEALNQINITLDNYSEMEDSNEENLERVQNSINTKIDTIKEMIDLKISNLIELYKK